LGIEQDYRDATQTNLASSAVAAYFGASEATRRLNSSKNL
jgi:hypothetical protein